MLADAAQAVEGKLYILGGGWSITGPQPTAMAIALKLEVPWDQANRRHRWQIELLDGDGLLVQLSVMPNGGHLQTVHIQGELEVGRPAGLPPGTALDVPMAINIGPLPLPPGQRFVWKLTIDEETREDWQVLPLQGGGNSAC